MIELNKNIERNLNNYKNFKTNNGKNFIDFTFRLLAPLTDISILVEAASISFFETYPENRLNGE